MPSSPYTGLLCGIPCMLMSGSSFLWRYTVYDHIRRKHILDSLPLFFQWISIPCTKTLVVEMVPKGVDHTTVNGRNPESLGIY